VVTLELVVNRHDLAPNIGHLCVTSHLVLGELRHLVRVVMRDTGVLSRLGERVLARGPLTTREQHIQPAPQLREPLSQIGRDAHRTKVYPHPENGDPVDGLARREVLCLPPPTAMR
jgi:hypothetical protein